MSAPIELGDVAAWVRAADAGDGSLAARAIVDLSLDEAQQAIERLIVLVSLALDGTGGRTPEEWLAALIRDQRRPPEV
mgnify:CR=1 FL=1|jgi:hypothetical protein